MTRLGDSGDNHREAHNHYENNHKNTVDSHSWEDPGPGLVAWIRRFDGRSVDGRADNVHCRLWHCRRVNRKISEQIDDDGKVGEDKWDLREEHRSHFTLDIAIGFCMIRSQLNSPLPLSYWSQKSTDHQPRPNHHTQLFSSSRRLHWRRKVLRWRMSLPRSCRNVNISWYFSHASHRFRLLFPSDIPHKCRECEKTDAEEPSGCLERFRKGQCASADNQVEHVEEADLKDDEVLLGSETHSLAVGATGSGGRIGVTLHFRERMGIGVAVSLSIISYHSMHRPGERNLY